MLILVILQKKPVKISFLRNTISTMVNKKIITLAIADDHKAIRQTLKFFLMQEANFNVIFEAADGLDLLQKLSCQQPDVLLLDIRMPRLSGIDALKTIHSSYPVVRVLIFSACSDDFYVSEALQYGINGYLTKYMDIGLLKEAIYAACKNEIHFNEMLSHQLLKSYMMAHKKSESYLLPEFSYEEVKILELLKAEKSTEEISEEMSLSKRSIELKRDKMRQKSSTKTVAGLLLYAVKRNLIDI